MASVVAPSGDAAMIRAESLEVAARPDNVAGPESGERGIQRTAVVQPSVRPAQVEHGIADRQRRDETRMLLECCLGRQRG